MSPRSLNDANPTLTKEPDDIEPLLISLAQPEPLLHRESTRAARLESPNSTRRLAPNDYTRLVQGIHKIVRAILPQGSVVVVISKGDSKLVAFKKRFGRHFPQGPDGEYAGYHPADSAGAISELDRLRANGADYLLVPNSSFWWLEHYEAFANHLDAKYRRVWDDEICRIYQVSDRKPALSVTADARRRLSLAPVRSRQRSREARPEELRVAIDTRIPEQLIVGEGNAFCLGGWCYHAEADVAKLEVVCNGSIQPLKTWGIPRPDVKAAHYPHQDHTGRSLCSGFWGFVPVEKISHRSESGLTLRATLSNGVVCERALAHIVLEPSLANRNPVQQSAPAPKVAICMATYNPPIELFKRQIESIRNQTFTGWICIISDDGSRPDIFEQVYRVVRGDSRFQVSRNASGMGFYRNFEHCLALAPQQAQFIALSDHDDYWHPDKLQTLLENFDPDTSLVYSDMRIVEESGREISPTYWTTRPNNFSKFGSLIMANTITGGASMFRRDLLERVLPFPERVGEAYHDHWIGAVALATGKIKYVNRPLYDYVQHRSNVIGHYAPSRPMSLFPNGSSLRRPREMVRETLSLWQRIYSSDLVRLQLMTEILKLRCGRLMTPAKAAELRRIQHLGKSWKSLFWLAGRALAGRGKISETVGAERPLLGAALWRHSARSRLLHKIAARNGYPSHAPANRTAAPQPHSAVETVREKIAPLRLKISSEAPTRLNLLVPTIDLKYFFGGYITKFNLARRLAEEGYKVRMVVVDHCDWQPAHWRQQLMKFTGLERFFDHVEMAYAFDRSAALEVSPDDVFVATTWWTAHIAHHAAQSMDRGHFLYLIQEYEPFTFAMGSFAALANQSYEFPHYAIFSTEMLRGYFRENRLGVFAHGAAHGNAHSVAFQNAITNVGAISREDLEKRMNKRLLYYARPEPHAARNMFELGVLALSEAVQDGFFDTTWEFYGIGAVGSGQKVPLGNARFMTMLPRENQEAYREILRAHDLGLALMYTPHPSLVPIEMAAAGMIVVTTAYANKTQEVLAEVSQNLIATHPSIEQIKLGLKKAILQVNDYDRRVDGSHVRWATDWESAFNSDVLARVGEFVSASRTHTGLNGASQNFAQ